MQHTDFYIFPDMHRSRQSKKVKLPKLAEIREVRFEKDSTDLIFKLELDGEEDRVAFLKPKVDINAPIPTSEAPRGISSTKKNGILKLIQTIAPPKQKFWHDLSVNDETADLVSSFE